MNTLSKITINGNEYSFDPLSTMKVITPKFLQESGTVTLANTNFIQISNMVICFFDIAFIKIPSDAIKDDDVKRYRIPLLEFTSNIDKTKYRTIQLMPFKCDMAREPAFVVPSEMYPKRLNIHIPFNYNKFFWHGEGIIFLS